MNKPLLLAGTQLLDLPDELLGAVLRQLRDRESNLHVFRASKRLAIALLQHTPAIELSSPFSADGNEDTGRAIKRPKRVRVQANLVICTAPLLDLPDMLLCAVLRQLRDRESRLHVFRTSKRLAIALLQHTPAIELRYPLGAIGDEDDEENGTCPTAFEYSTQRLAPFLTHALLARKAALQLSLQPAARLLIKWEDCIAAGDDSMAVDAVAAKLAYDTLGALELCPAVTHLAVKFMTHFTDPPLFAQLPEMDAGRVRTTQLLDLPDELLSAVLRQLDDDESRLHVFMTSKRLATAMLQNAPSIQLTYPTAANYDDHKKHDKPVAAFLAQALEAREAPVKLTLRPDEDLYTDYFRDKAEAQAGLVAQGTLPVAPGGGGAAGGKEWIANPVLPQDILQRTTQLLHLPDELLSAVLRQLDDAESRLHVFMTSKRLATALLQHTPSIQLTYPTDASYDDDKERDKPIAAFLAQALEAREAPVKLTLKPDEDLFASYFKNRAKAEAVARLASSTLGAVGLCTAVKHLNLCISSDFGAFWKPLYSAAELSLTPTQLGLLVSHPLMLPRLRHVDISEACIEDGSDDEETVTSPFLTSNLQHLTLSWGDWDFIPHLAPLAPHLTQLEVLEALLSWALLQGDK
ncbi:hypothetical protein V8C86DRAFT_2439727 [Haematococcus lacustris]